MNRSIRLVLAFLFAVAIAPIAFAEELADADVIAKHLEFFGYTVERSPEGLKATHPQNMNFMVKPLRGGTLFITYITTEADAKKPENRAGVLDFVNEFNNNSVLVNFYLDKDGDLGASAWYPGPYEKTTFGALVDRWNSDIKEALQRDPERSKALIQ